MVKGILVIGFVLLVAGLFVWLVPGKSWRSWWGPRSKWGNQTSAGALSLFSGLLLIGAGLFGVIAGDFWLGVRSQNWTRVTAVVTDGRIVEVMQPRSPMPSFRPQVDYQYHWEGTPIRGGRLSFRTETSHDEAFVKKRLGEEFPVGKEITVHVDPAEPSRSVIEPGPDPLHWIYAGAALVFAGVGANGLRMLRKNWDG